jgi:hypothetical protein
MVRWQIGSVWAREPPTKFERVMTDGGYIHVERLLPAMIAPNRYAVEGEAICEICGNGRTRSFRCDSSQCVLSDILLEYRFTLERMIQPDVIEPANVVRLLDELRTKMTPYEDVMATHLAYAASARLHQRLKAEGVPVAPMEPLEQLVNPELWIDF